MRRSSDGLHCDIGVLVQACLTFLNIYNVCSRTDCDVDDHFCKGADGPDWNRQVRHPAHAQSLTNLKSEL